jgi:hypothetical protein
MQQRHMKDVTVDSGSESGRADMILATSSPAQEDTFHSCKHSSRCLMYST